MSATYEETKIQLLAPYPIDEKLALEQNDLVNSNDIPATRGHCCRGTRGRERNALVKGGMIALVVSLMTLISFLATAALCPGMHSLLKRQNGGSNTNSGNAFTNDKLWIIIICVVGTRHLKSPPNFRCHSLYCVRCLCCLLLLSRSIQKSDMLSLLYSGLLWMFRFVRKIHFV
jgi:hypothetical protein